jgi:hypothetical protein
MTGNCASPADLSDNPGAEGTVTSTGGTQQKATVDLVIKVDGENAATEKNADNRD